METLCIPDGGQGKKNGQATQWSCRASAPRTAPRASLDTEHPNGMFLVEDRLNAHVFWMFIYLLIDWFMCLSIQIHSHSISIYMYMLNTYLFLHYFFFYFFICIHLSIFLLHIYIYISLSLYIWMVENPTKYTPTAWSWFIIIVPIEASSFSAAVPVRLEPFLHVAKKGQCMLPQVPAITPWADSSCWDVG